MFFVVLIYLFVSLSVSRINRILINGFASNSYQTVIYFDLQTYIVVFSAQMVTYVHIFYSFKAVSCMFNFKNVN